MVNRRLIVLFAFSCITAYAFAQTKKPPVPRPVSNPGQTLLWEISGKGLPQPSYLYGTMHIVCSENTKLSAGLQNAMRNITDIFFEIDMDDMKEIFGIIKYARMNDGVKISDLVTPIEFQRLEAYFKANSTPIPFSMMNTFKPYFVTALISESMINCKSKSSVEQMIMNAAKDSARTISGLESLEFQASLFDSIPYDKQAKDLVSYVDSIDRYRKMTVDMMELYQMQDLEAMDTMMVQADPGMSEYLDLLLYNRNFRWSFQIPEQAFRKPTLFAVGAGHLGGERGVINLLKKQGFTLKPLKN